LRVGDGLRRSIDQGLASSRYGVVILSPHFFGKEWPQKELDGLVARETTGEKVVLPVWHNISADQIRGHSPSLADRVAVSSDRGLEHVVSELLKVLQPEERDPEVNQRAITVCERLIEAGCALHSQGLSTFRRVDLRNWIMDKYPDVTKKRWQNTYNPCIQGMKEPRPEHPPPVGQKYRDIFQWYKEDHTYALTQYGRSIEGCEHVEPPKPMKRLADEIREFVCENYIKPARERGEKQIAIRAGDVHKEMGLVSRIPAVCSALGTNKFQDLCGIELIRREGPTNGSNVHFTFKLD